MADSNSGDSKAGIQHDRRLHDPRNRKLGLSGPPKISLSHLSKETTNISAVKKPIKSEDPIKPLSATDIYKTIPLEAIILKLESVVDENSALKREIKRLNKILQNTTKKSGKSKGIFPKTKKKDVSDLSRMKETGEIDLLKKRVSILLTQSAKNEIDRLAMKSKIMDFEIAVQNRRKV